MSCTIRNSGPHTWRRWAWRKSLAWITSDVWEMPYDWIASGKD